MVSDVERASVGPALVQCGLADGGLHQETSFESAKRRQKDAFTVEPRCSNKRKPETGQLSKDNKSGFGYWCRLIGSTHANALWCRF